ncbi:MAG: NAD(P)/FAD-dependent oxidoreductase, partial [Pseudobdellovibrionaceae bacterium]
FAAINAAEKAKSQGLPVEIQILEASKLILKKVRISGGGRCNVTHNLYEIPEFCLRYPRGSRELESPFHIFQARDTVEWFKNRGVTLVAEEDGRMFPDTNTSETIINCFLEAAKKLEIQIQLNHKVDSIQRLESGTFSVQIANQEPKEADAVMIATGSSSFGYQLATNLGHSITELAPSLFSFKIEDPLISELSGLSFEDAEVNLWIENKTLFKERGPLLITHWGLSGPAILKISAWAAREMLHSNYLGVLKVNWTGLQRREEVLDLLRKVKDQGHKSQIQNIYPEVLAKRFWLKALEKANIHLEKRWAEISKKELLILVEILFSSEFKILGKNRYKDEFVECGGIALNEINFKKMESKICPNLYFAGEVLDIDGITGGFNFQNAWTGAWIAAQNMAH